MDRADYPQRRSLPSKSKAKSEAFYLYDTACRRGRYGQRLLYQYIFPSYPSFLVTPALFPVLCYMMPHVPLATLRPHGLSLPPLFPGIHFLQPSLNGRGRLVVGIGPVSPVHRRDFI